MFLISCFGVLDWRSCVQSGGRLGTPALRAASTATVPTPTPRTIGKQSWPTNAQAADPLVGHDCLPIVLGVGVGTVAVDAARKAGVPNRPPDWTQERQSNTPKQLIRNIHSIMLHDNYFLAFGARCVIVTGEP